MIFNTVETEKKGTSFERKKKTRQRGPIYGKQILRRKLYAGDKASLSHLETRDARGLRLTPTCARVLVGTTVREAKRDARRAWAFKMATPGVARATRGNATLSRPRSGALART